MTSAASRPTRLLRRLLATTSLVLGVALAAALAAAGPASADVPEGWSDPAAVDPLHAALIISAIPIGLALVLVALVYLPPLLRGESVRPGAPEISNQWLGGPSRSAGELAAPDGDDSQAGGASARW
ncbi:hypothetical protein K8Z61_00745 [Nocardioides sp. TRM66260-LWL]|uniref:hypothetical protein n=1 Tax=Nocardioides sp. TRM66260-LWL TaxID=2874478 RepID=UPI001CC3D95C|nr:hypothetical protein [Nocardioides sp. TRM66260-LWL]MBZ5733012.1 hypothetical protein [Nocardioides sp. TRM66260-LWL]